MSTTATSSVVAEKPDTDPVTCSARYHTRLAQDVLSKARATQAVADELRAAAPDMPGRWLFWDGSGVLARTAHQRRLMATQQLDLQSNRMCVHSILARGGRIRCLKWKPIPAGYKPPKPKLPTVDPTKTEVSAAERRIAGSLSRRVSHKGAFVELEHGSAFFHLVQRTTDELIVYASQPHNPTICSGAREMVGFYRSKLEPLTHKAASARRLKSETRTAAIATAKVALGSAGAPSAEKPSDVVALLRELLAKNLSEEEFFLLENINVPLKVLERSRDMLTTQRFDAMPSSQRARLRKSLRNIEFMIYAAHNEEHLSRLNRSFNNALQAITTAHREACICAN